jgi:PIN domain nuclease of toxin-antitoxin system
MEQGKPGKPMPTEAESGVILDTHIWVWLTIGSSELSKSSIGLIERAAASGLVYIPAIVVWEVATLAAKRRLTFKMPTRQWVEEALSQQGINLIPLLPTIAVESTELPGEFHSDPADRIIVATARIKSLPIMTRDAKILDYARKGNLTAIKA